MKRETLPSGRRLLPKRFPDENSPYCNLFPVMSPEGVQSGGKLQARPPSSTDAPRHRRRCRQRMYASGKNACRSFFPEGRLRACVPPSEKTLLVPSQTKAAGAAAATPVKYDESAFLVMRMQKEKRGAMRVTKMPGIRCRLIRQLRPAVSGRALHAWRGSSSKASGSREVGASSAQKTRKHRPERAPRTRPSLPERMEKNGNGSAPEFRA